MSINEIIGLFGIATAYASSLGWTTVITSIFTEIRNIGLICFGGGITIAGIELLFSRHLDRLGQVMAATGVGGALIAAGGTAGAALVGAGGASVMGGVHVVGLVEAVGDVLGIYLYHTVMLSTILLGWFESRRHIRRQG